MVLASDPEVDQQQVTRQRDSRPHSSRLQKPQIRCPDCSQYDCVGSSSKPSILSVLRATSASFSRGRDQSGHGVDTPGTWIEKPFLRIRHTSWVQAQSCPPETLSFLLPTHQLPEKLHPHTIRHDSTTVAGRYGPKAVVTLPRSGARSELTSREMLGPAVGLSDSTRLAKHCARTPLNQD